MSIVSLLCFSLDTTITPSRIEKEAVTLLAETADIQKIPMLLSVVGHLDAKSRESVQAALTHLLPTVTLSDSHLFDEETRLRLLARLEGTARSWPYYSDVPVDYVLAIIQCLSSLEEQRALTHLVKLNASIQLNKTSETLAVAAKEAISVIEAAKGRNKLAGSLVRPAECPNSSSPLQPAGSPAGEEENLLYASSRTQ